MWNWMKLPRSLNRMRNILRQGNMQRQPEINGEMSKPTEFVKNKIKYNIFSYFNEYDTFSKSLMFSTDSVWVSSGPNLHVLLVVMVPDFLVLLLLVCDVILHHNDLVVFGDVSFRQLSVIDVDLAVHFQVFVLKADQILIKLMSLDWNWTVVIEEQIEKWNVFGISVILKTEWLFSDVKHQVTIESEENFWRGVLSSFFNFISNILDFDVNILETSFSLQTHTDCTVDFYSCKWIRIIFSTKSLFNLLFCLDFL